MPKSNTPAPGTKSKVELTTPADDIAKQATAEQAAPQQQPAQQVSYSVSPGLAGFLAALDVSFAFSSYQSGKFYLTGRNPHGGIMINERFFQKAMGISVENRQSILLATNAQIIDFEDTLGDDQFINDTYDACYVPRIAYTTGALDAHDVGRLEDGRIAFVNTRFNCVSVLSKTRSFKPIWKPAFISKIVDEDRCHLNGMAIEGGKIRYLTAVSKSDTIDGWRDRRADGGIIIDYEKNEVVATGLSMPHSPRMYNGQLWVLNSGTGELGRIAFNKAGKKGKFVPVAFCPGFVRGLAFSGKYAFVGLSKPRYQRFKGLPLDEKLQQADSEPWCGIQIIDLETGTCVQWLRIDGAIGELYDVGVLEGVRTPMSLGFMGGEIMSLITHEDLEEAK